MKTTRVFKSGNSMAVRLPKDFGFHGDEVEIIQRGNEVILRDIPQNLAEAFNLLAKLDDFFHEERKDSPPQERDFF